MAVYQKDVDLSTISFVDEQELLLTKKGEATACYINEKISEFLAIGGAGLTEEERERFYSCLRLIAGNLKHYLDSEETTNSENGGIYVCKNNSRASAISAAPRPCSLKRTAYSIKSRSPMQAFLLSMTNTRSG